MGSVTDTLMVVHCPYCRAGIDFRLMIGYKNGRVSSAVTAPTQCARASPSTGALAAPA